MDWTAARRWYSAPVRIVRPASDGMQGGQGMDASPPSESPRLVALERALASGDGTSLDAFWRAVARDGTPLIELIPDDPDQALVTFLWRATTPLARAAVFPLSQVLGTEIAEHRMARLGDTDVWYTTCRVRRDFRGAYRLSPDDPLTSLREVTSPAGWRARTAMWCPDPLNPRRFVVPDDEERPEQPGFQASVLALPGAPPQPWIDARPGVPAGAVTLHRFRSRILGNERRLWVYTPPGYAATGAPYGLLVLFDGWSYTQLVPTPTILDNLIAAGRIPPLVALLPDNPDQAARTRELPCHEPFVASLADELLPWAHRRYHLTTDPTKTIAAGASYGGLAAAFVGLRRPDLFGNVLSQSGSFRWAPPGDPEHEWLARQYAARPTGPLRFYLDVGALELGPRDAGPNQVVANRHLRDVLRARGHAPHYAEYAGGHEYLCWQGTLADGLLALLQRPPISA